MSIIWTVVSFFAPIFALGFINYNMMPEKPGFIILGLTFLGVIGGAFLLPAGFP